MYTLLNHDPPSHSSLVSFSGRDCPRPDVRRTCIEMSLRPLHSVEQLDCPRETQRRRSRVHPHDMELRRLSGEPSRKRRLFVSRKERAEGGKEIGLQCRKLGLLHQSLRLLRLGRIGGRRTGTLRDVGVDWGDVGRWYGVAGIGVQDLVFISLVKRGESVPVKVRN